MFGNKLKKMFTSKTKELEDRIHKLEYSNTQLKKNVAVSVFIVNFKAVFKNGDVVTSSDNYEYEIISNDVITNDVKLSSIDYWGDGEYICGMYVYRNYQVVNRIDNRYFSMPEWSLYKMSRKIKENKEYEKYKKLITK